MVENPLNNITLEGRTDAPLREKLRLFHDRYELVRMLGAGGMGVVWLAADRKLQNKPCALKFLPGVRAWSPVELERLQKEVITARDLRHENIVATHGFEHDPPYAAMIMEHLEGRTLKQLLEASPGGCLGAAEIRPWMRTLVAALKYLHGVKGRVHRDIKAANIMLTSEGVLKIMDFGISEQVRHSLSQHSVAQPSTGSSHTLASSSPQQLRGDPAAETDDIYSIGTLMYELLSGRPPFFRGNSDVIGHQIRNEQPPTISQRREELRREGILAAVPSPVPPEWEKIVLDCLSKDPLERPTLDELDDFFARPLIEQPVVTPRPTQSSVTPVGVPPSIKRQAPIEIPRSGPTVPRRSLKWLVGLALVAGASWVLYDRLSPGPAPISLPSPIAPVRPAQTPESVARMYYEVTAKPDWQKKRQELWAPQVSYFEKQIVNLDDIAKEEARHRKLWDSEKYKVEKTAGVKALPDGRVEVALEVLLDFMNSVESFKGRRRVTMVLGMHGSHWRIESIGSRRIGENEVQIKLEAQRHEIEAFLDKLITLGNKPRASGDAPPDLEDYYESEVARFFNLEGKVPTKVIRESEEDSSRKCLSKKYWWTTPVREVEDGAFGSELLTLKGEIAWEIVNLDKSVSPGTATQMVTISYYGKPKVRAIWIPPPGK